MNLKQWLNNGWLRNHKTSKNEISNLFAIVERDMKDAKVSISDDRRFGIAYADELIEFVSEFKTEIIAWLKVHHPDLS